jgi:NAD/NADP transhydrogenase alpha subunit
LTLLGIVCSKGLFLYSAKDCVPRMSRAQKMDALSSMAGIAGRIGSDVRPFHN